jgi:hypothetical protein
MLFRVLRDETTAPCSDSGLKTLSYGGQAGLKCRAQRIFSSCDEQPVLDPSKDVDGPSPLRWKPAGSGTVNACPDPLSGRQLTFLVACRRGRSESPSVVARVAG